jgi:PPOX class probable F420-dependent enzyme
MSPQSRSLDELPRWAGELIESARVAHLGLLDADDRPRVMPVTFAVAGGELWTAVDHKPKRTQGGELARVRWLRRNPAAALTVDRYSDDWERLAWVQALGRVDVLDEPEAAALDALRAKYEQYRGHPPRGPFLRLAPARLLFWRADAL